MADGKDVSSDVEDGFIRFVGNAYEKIKDDDNAVDALNKTYEAKRKGVILGTFEFFIDHYRNWWD